MFCRLDAYWFAWLYSFCVIPLGVDTASGRFQRQSDIVKEFLEGPRARTCDFPSVKIKRDQSWEKFQKSKYHQQPTVLKGLIGDSSWHSRHWNKSRFIADYGEYIVRVGDARYDKSECPIHYESNLSQYAIDAAGTDTNLLAKAYGLPLVHELLWGSRSALPAFFEDFVYRPTLQISTEIGTGTHFHYHDETWLALLHGVKAWWIAPKETPETVKKEVDHHTANPCNWLIEAPPQGLRFCVQQAGEVLYFGNGVYHATCNLDEFTLGLGSQGAIPPNWSPLEHALHRNYVDFARQFIDAHRDQVEGARDYVQNWLNLVVEKGHTEAAALLLEARADPNRKSTVHPFFYPLFITGRSSHVEVADFLIRNLAEINPRRNDILNPLSSAVASGSVPVATLLLKRRADVNEINPVVAGKTPLLIAVDKSGYKMVDLLVSARARMDAKDSDGKSAFDIVKSNCPEGLLTAARLREYGAPGIADAPAVAGKATFEL